LVDAEDWSIVRILGSPAKRPSFWTRQTEIDHRYKRIDGMWLSDSLESTSDILIAGRSTLKIQYLYETIETWRPGVRGPKTKAKLYQRTGIREVER
jgi:hypothetical protein